MRWTWLYLLLAAAASVAAQEPPAKRPTLGILILQEDYGRATYAACRLTVYYSEPPLSRTDRAELACSPNSSPRINDVHVSRRLSGAEVRLIAKLANASNLYSGGHVGTVGTAALDGASQRLEVAGCCGRRDLVVLITDGNATFSEGSRRDLSNLLSKWRAELRPKLAPAKTQ